MPASNLLKTISGIKPFDFKENDKIKIEVELDWVADLEEQVLSPKRLAKIDLDNRQQVTEEINKIFADASLEIVFLNMNLIEDCQITITNSQNDKQLLWPSKGNPARPLLKTSVSNRVRLHSFYKSDWIKLDKDLIETINYFYISGLNDRYKDQARGDHLKSITRRILQLTSQWNFTDLKITYPFDGHLSLQTIFDPPMIRYCLARFKFDAQAAVLLNSNNLYDLNNCLYDLVTAVAPNKLSINYSEIHHGFKLLEIGLVLDN
jgi:hypothetical protein